MSDVSEVLDALEKQGDALTKFKIHIDGRIGEMGERITRFEARQGRVELGGATHRPPSGLERGGNRALDEAIRACFRGDETEMKAMSVGDDANGGFLVVPALAQQMTVVEMDFSPMRRLARIIPIEQADAYEEPVDKDTSGASWVGEQSARPATASPKIAMLRIPVHEIYAMPEATQQMIDDARFNVEQWLIGKLGQQFGTAEGIAYINGDGVTKPRGFLTYPTAATADASRPWGTFEHVVTGTSGGFGTDPNGATKLIDVVHRLKAGYRKGAVWLMNKKTVGEVRKLKDGAGRFVWADSLLPDVPPSLLGYPVFEDENMPDIGANSLSIAFGNFARGYTIVDRAGVKLLRDPFTNKPLVRLYTTKRVGGDVNDYWAIKLLKFST
jgi:HK97 family phage major capsid protein